MGKYTGPSFYSLTEARERQLLRRGDVIQIKRSKFYMHTVLFEDYDNCFHITWDDNDSLHNVNAAIMGVVAFIRKHPLEHILENNQDNQAGQSNLCLFRINNQEKKALKQGIDLTVVNSDPYLNHIFRRLGDLTNSRNEIEVAYQILIKNCETYVYEWKYGKKWSPQSELAYRCIGVGLINTLLIILNRTRILSCVVTVCGVSCPVAYVCLVGIDLGYFIFENWETISPYVDSFIQELAANMQNNHMMQ